MLWQYNNEQFSLSPKEIMEFEETRITLQIFISKLVYSNSRYVFFNNSFTDLIFANIQIFFNGNVDF